jgi:hypothetical protein
MLYKDDDERLAVIELAKVAAQFPFLEDDINPLIVRLITKGVVTPGVAVIAQEHGMTKAIAEYRRLYFKKPTLSEAKSEIVWYFKNNGLSFLDK